MSRELFIPIRPGIMEYVIRGDISYFELGLYLAIQSQANFSSGVWHGSAARLQATGPRGAKLREIQRGIEHLVSLGLLRPFHTHGQRGNYPVLINKFTVRSGALRGLRLNAAKSDSWSRPVYEVCADDDADVRAEDAPIQEVRIRSKKKKEEAPAAPSPSIFTGQHFSVTQKQDALLGGAFPWVDRPAEYRKVDSWLEANPGRRPRKADRFLHNWFQRISPPKGGKTNGRQTATDLAIQNAKALGLDRCLN